uniref:Uncharacterized protein n=1 Tax=Amphimedon queenslandica TaxID=400682 RepID=A0A1X7USD7_AMPQE
MERTPLVLILFISLSLVEGQLQQQGPVVLRKNGPKAPRPSIKPFGKEAYVTLVNGKSEASLLMVLVLGVSLKETKSSIERVVLCPPDVTAESKAILKENGWTIRMIEEFDPRPIDDASFNKLQLWKMTEYRRVVWIEPNALVVKNIDHLFRCGNFCAVFQISNSFRTTVMVVKPSIIELSRILTWDREGSNKITVPILLNKFYNNYYKLKYSVMYDPKDPSYNEEPLRLSAGYQVGIFMHLVNSHWYMSDDEIFVIDYEMLSIHPVYWWTYPLLEVNWMWYSYRTKLASHVNDPSLFLMSNVMPLVCLGLLYVVLRCFPMMFRIANHSCTKSAMNFIASAHDGFIVSLIPLIILVVSYVGAFQLIPSTMWPVQAWLLYGMWLLTFLLLFYGPLCYFLYVAGNCNPEIYSKRIAECVVHLLTFAILHIISLFILYSIRNFHKRLVALIICCLFCLVYGTFAGKRVLKLWCHSRPLGCFPSIQS